MYPLQVTLVGRSDETLQPVRAALLAVPAAVAAEFSTYPSALAGVGPCKEGDGRRLFVCVLEAEEDYHGMRKLRESFIGEPIVALVPTLDDPLAIVAAMRFGAAQVVPLPLDDEDFRAALDCIALMFGFPSAESKVVAVSGVTGGCGATTLATNLAAELASQRNLDVILLELSFQMGMVATYLDVTPRHTTYDLLTNMDRVDLESVRDALTPVGKHLSILPGPQQLVAPRGIYSRDVLQLLDYCKRLCDVVVIDLPCTYDDLFFETLASTTHVLVVAEQKLPSVRAMKVLCDTLERDLNLGSKPIQRHLVINRYSNRDREFGVDKLEKILGVAAMRTVSNDHAAVSGAINKGRTLRQDAPRSPALKDINDLANELFREAERGPTVGARPVLPRPGGRNGSVLSKFRKAIGMGT